MRRRSRRESCPSIEAALGPLGIPANAEVLAWLRREDPSAHSDVASELLDAARGLGPVRSFCPDPAGYKWVALADERNRIFALAFGMSAVAFRVGAEGEERALAEGAVEAPELGEGWVRFTAYRPEERREEGRARLRRWCRAAREAAGRAPRGGRS